MRCIYGGIRESRVRPRWSWVSQSNTLPVCAGTDGRFVPPCCACKCGRWTCICVHGRPCQRCTGSAAPFDGGIGLGTRVTRPQSRGDVARWFDAHHPVARAFVVLRTQEQRRADGIDGENSAPLPNGITMSAATRPLDPMEVYVVYRTADAWYAPPAMMREINLQPRSDGAVHGGNDTVAEVAAIVNHGDSVNLPNVAAPPGDSDAQGRRFVSQYSTLYDTLRYVLFFPTGVGGWGQRGLGRSAQRPLSTAGHPFTCGGYARAAIYQKEVLSLLPRLTQEYMLDEFSRRESIACACVTLIPSSVC